MDVKLRTCVVRSWRTSDAEPIAGTQTTTRSGSTCAMRFRIPYTIHDAREFIRATRISVRRRRPSRSRSTTRRSAASGSCCGSDVERVSAEIGYWLGRAVLGARHRHARRWSAVTGLRDRGSTTLTRVYAVPFAWNTASCRVLEKAGYVLEARLRRSAVKDGKVTIRCSTRSSPASRRSRRSVRRQPDWRGKEQPEDERRERKVQPWRMIGRRGVRLRKPDQRRGSKHKDRRERRVFVMCAVTLANEVGCARPPIAAVRLPVGVGGSHRARSAATGSRG